MIDRFPDLRAAALIATYPEFATAGALAVSAIEYALKQVDERFYGTKADDAVLLVAADWLANHPYGMSLRLVDDGKPSRYMSMLDAIKNQIPSRFMVL